MRHYLLDLLNSKNVSNFHSSFFARKRFQYMYIHPYLTKILLPFPDEIIIKTTDCILIFSQIKDYSVMPEGEKLWRGQW